MKNLIQINTVVKCIYCYTKGFYTDIDPNTDADFCPCCTKHDFVRGHWGRPLHKKYFNYNDPDDESMYDYDSFCSTCRILYKPGCTHIDSSSNGEVYQYNAHFIRKWKYKDNVYIGMPQFDSLDEWFSEVKEIEILEWVCINSESNQNKCSHTTKEHKCNLKKL
jgi:hypothetical protein